MFQVYLTGVLLAILVTAAAEDPPVDEVDAQKKRGGELLEAIVSQQWAGDWKGAELQAVRLVEQKPDLERPTGLPPVWFATIKGPKDQTGYLMWESSDDGRLVEFSLDASLAFTGKNAVAIKGVPALQQFAIDDGEGKSIASGCVPTSAASVISFWATKKFPHWKGEDGKTPADLARRIRSRLEMIRFPDNDGFTENGMALAGAQPHKLAEAIRDDAEAHEVEIKCDFQRFSMEKLKEEIGASRPALVSCVVRVPHKPELSWGHELAAVGWAELDGVELVGVLDNFFPTKYPDTVRWIRKGVFSSLITLRPVAAEEP